MIQIYKKDDKACKFSVDRASVRSSKTARPKHFGKRPDRPKTDTKSPKDRKRTERTFLHTTYLDFR